MMRNVLFLCCLVGCTQAPPAVDTQVVSTNGADGHLVLERLESRIFGNTRTVRVWLPPGYHDPLNASRVYPTLYLNDGQNIFDAETSFNQMEWRVDEIASDLISDGRIRPVIIVGIDNGGREARAKEYLPYPDAFLTPPEPDPQGARYADFLEREVIPLIETRYRASHSRSDRVLGGSSYGALVTAHVVISKPSLFAAVLLESPSFYVDDNHVLRDAARAGIQLEKAYLGVGTNELSLAGCPDHPGNIEAVDGVNQMAALFRRAGLAEQNGRLFVSVDRCAVHNELAWSKRFPQALSFLFSAELH